MPGHQKIFRDFFVCSSGNTNQLSITATGESVVGINYIGLINGYCQDKKIQCDYILDHRDGPAHKPQSVSITDL